MGRTLVVFVLLLSTVFHVGVLTAKAVDEEVAAVFDVSGVKGGLVVHLIGPPSPANRGQIGELTVKLRNGGAFIVQALAVDPAVVDSTRTYIESRGFYGAVSVDGFDGTHLPFVENSVNLLVVSGSRGGADRAGVVPGEEEILRALVPAGVAVFLEGGNRGPAPDTLVKPLRSDTDEWTHFLQDATGNAVAHDSVVGPPHRLQWRAGPEHTRHHEHASSITTVVSSGGRIFTIQDEGPRASMLLPPKWGLCARDAYNGVRLWTRFIASWHSHLTGMLSGPASFQRTLVAVGDHVYVTLGVGQAVSDLDAATGQTLQVYDATAGAEEIVYANGRLFVVVRSHAETAGVPGRKSPASTKRIIALDAAAGSVLWEKGDAAAATVLSLTLAVCGERVFFQSRMAVVCVASEDGRELWHSARPELKKRIRNLAPTLVACPDVVLCADRLPDARGGFAASEIVALSAADGRVLWSRPCARGWVAPVDVFVADGIVWIGTKRGRGWIVGADKKGEADFSEGIDLLTGEVKRTLDTTAAFINRPHHHRCYRNKATDRFLLVGRHGVGFIPLQTGATKLHDWIRGTCRYGILPCNGLLYLPPHTCSCHVRSLLSGFLALAPAAPGQGEPIGDSDGNRLERGPAYAAGLHPSSVHPHPSPDWPTYRHDSARSSATGVDVPTPVGKIWEANLGGRLTSMVAAEGKLLVAAADRHTVYALDAATGQTAWRFVAGGRVDSPPTIYRGRALFGSADGWVYCLRLADGCIAWRFRAAPSDRRTVVDDRVESIWPVHGSVLVKDGAAYVAAGRTSNLDGGIRVYQLETDTGRVLSQRCLNSRQPGAGKTQQGLLDLMVDDGEFACMRFQRFSLRDVSVGPKPGAKGKRPPEPRRLICPTGFLGNSWWHRTHWTFGTDRGFGDPRTIGMRFPAGQILAFDDDVVYGYGRKPEYFMWTTPVSHRLFAADRRSRPIPLELTEPQPKQPWLKRPERQFATRWSRDVPFHVRAMVVAHKTLFIAGPPKIADEGKPSSFLRKNPFSPAQINAAADAWEGRSGALLWGVSTVDGATVAQGELSSPPVFDGMIAAHGRLFVATVSGQVLALGGGK